MTEKLLPSIAKNVFITAHDFYGKKYKKALHKFMFSVRAYGILKENDKILIQRHPLLNQFGLPGGGIDMGENVTQGLCREFFEETGLKIKVGKVLGVQDDFFTHENEDIHGVLIYYEVEKIGGKLITKGNAKDVAGVKFLDIKDFKEKHFQNVFWKFLKKYLK